jgi:hypothetical protein
MSMGSMVPEFRDILRPDAVIFGIRFFGGRVGKDAFQISKGYLGVGFAAHNMVCYDTLGNLGGDVAVENPGATGELDIHQRLGKTKAKATNFADGGPHTLRFQSAFYGINYRIAACGLAA